ncbi:MAG: aminotransferase class I/II-fold pyridoxal phosphate-dependent enzyme [Myxococcales bacterium]|nr:MAG: aminotransferase class I/II-fold pyridoxal phosphate-dependent enzyme [Myxococcales bacterium]
MSGMVNSTPTFSPAQGTDPIDEGVHALQKAGVIMLRASDIPYDGRHVVIDGRPLLNFGGCSYLGLELRTELRNGAIEATRRYGTQFSFSRAYLESPLYQELETELAALTGGQPLVTPSTTLGHIAALPVLIRPGDAVIVDQFAHASVQTAAGLVRGADLEPLRHSRLDRLEARLTALASRHERIWYLLDGVYSMHGDVAPLEGLGELLERFPGLHLYIDDAHAVSWAGHQGRGLALDAFAGHPRVVVALSLNKAFSAAGGCLVFSSSDVRDRVRRCGGPMLFSGPVQPPMLGAALASAWLHRSEEFPLLQQALAQRIDLVLSSQRVVPLVSSERTPIFFVPCGPDQACMALSQGLREAGFYTSPSIFPAVPRNRSGVRFTVSLHNSLEDIERLTGALAQLHQPLADTGS